eukprot:scaffold116751_cov35-Tisochrysis_lutea.AAC.2
MDPCKMGVVRRLSIQRELKPIPAPAGVPCCRAARVAGMWPSLVSRPLPHRERPLLCSSGSSHQNLLNTRYDRLIHKNSCCKLKCPYESDKHAPSKI